MNNLDRINTEINGYYSSVKEDETFVLDKKN